MRRAIVHVGTHKTGTKTIQAFLADNWQAFYDAGLYIPNAGRVSMGEGMYSPGHHELATSLRKEASAPLSALKAELESTNAPNILLSSEEFYPLLSQPDALALLRDTLRELGYNPYVVLYLRSQDEFVESMYVETMKTSRPPTFEAFLDEILAYGEKYHATPYAFIFEYARAISEFAEIFGDAAIVVRGFEESGAPTDLIGDFVRTLATILGGLSVPALRVFSQTLNRRSSVIEALSYVDGDAIAKLDVEPNDARLSERFAPMLLGEAIALRERFRSDNERVLAMTRVRIPEPSMQTPERWDRATWQRGLLNRLLETLPA